MEPSCHAELVSASCCCNKAVLGAVSHDNKYGFTMVEILVAVLIIAVLVIVAVPQYQKALLKSRFSSLIPPTKTVRNGQEAYYLQHSRYATKMDDLDVKIKEPKGMEIYLDDGSRVDFKYVFSTRPVLHNNLIMYQKQSPKFAGHTHCEALKNDSNANWLCNTALHGQLITGSLSGSDYNTYILEGTQGENDVFALDCPLGQYDNQGACSDIPTGYYVEDGEVKQCADGSSPMKHMTGVIFARLEWLEQVVGAKPVLPGTMPIQKGVLLAPSALMVLRTMPTIPAA